MSVMFIANIRITDEQVYNKYLAEVDAVFSRFNGEYVSVEDNALILEGKWDYSRLVAIRFPNMESLRQWYDSSDYQDILKYRLQGAECDSIVVKVR